MVSLRRSQATLSTTKRRTWENPVLAAASRISGGWDLIDSSAAMPSILRIVDMLMDGEKAEMVFSDPPYNVAIAGNVSGLG